MNYSDILKQALEEAERALWACTPTPVQFYSADIFGNQNEPAFPPDLEGNCGGAYITGIHGRDPFITWAKTNCPDLIRKGTYKGYDIRIPWSKFKKLYKDQSAERYEAGAKAYAKVLNDNGIKCQIHAYLT